MDLDGRPDLAASNTLAKRVTLLLNQSVEPAGSRAYGNGSPSCAGAIGLTAGSPPSVGNSAFRILCTNAPTASVSTVWFAAGSDPAGTRIPPLNLLIHLGLPIVNFGSFAVDASGTGQCPLPIPPDTSLAGVKLYCQGLFLASSTGGNTCSGSLLGSSLGLMAASSRGLELTIQP
jgi:hypothetical protein